MTVLFWIAGALALFVTVLFALKRLAVWAFELLVAWLMGAL